MTNGVFLAIFYTANLAAHGKPSCTRQLPNAGTKGRGCPNL